MINPATEVVDTKAQAVAALYQLQTVTTDWRVRLRNFLLSLAAFAVALAADDPFGKFIGYESDHSDGGAVCP